MKKRDMIFRVFAMLSAFFFVMTWNVYFYYSDKLTMYGQSGDSGLIESSADWVGIISQPWYFIVSGLIDGHPHMYLSWAIFFGIFSGAIVVTLIFFVTRKFPKVAPVIIFVYLAYGCVSLGYIVRDYPVYKSFSNGR